MSNKWPSPLPAKEPQEAFDDTQDDILGNFTFTYESEVHNRTIELSFSKPGAATNMEIITEFANFLSAIYGYRITLEKK